MFHSSLNYIPEIPHSKSFDHGKYGRIFRNLAPAKFDLALINALAKTMQRPPDDLPAADTRSMPAGYVYLGQFIAHDLTFDSSSVGERQADPEILSNFRTPALDLDSLYGSGPLVNPLYYRSLGGLFPVDDDSVDLFRRPAFRDEDFSIALIPDPRNDENRIVSQIHLLFQKLHNHLFGIYGNFEEAKKYTQWHYQWLIVNEFLRKIIHPNVLLEIFDISTPYKVKRVHYTWRNEPFIPIEFSAAAYRFGHAMVRNSYIIRRDEENGLITAAFEPPKARSIKPSESLFGFREQKERLDLSFFFGDKAQKSHAIEPLISYPLYDITQFNKKIKSQEPYDHANSLPFITMKKGVQLGLPNGEDVAKLLNQIPIDVDIREITHNNSFKNGSTPLWYYILHEAKTQQEERQQTLGVVASTIVAEVIIGVLQGDKSSYINQDPQWKPTFDQLGRDFSLIQLVKKFNKGQ